MKVNYSDNIVLERVFLSGNLAVLAVAESILMDAGFKFLTRHKAEQNLFDPGSWFGLPNYFIGPAGIFVLKEDADAAATILADIQESAFNPNLKPYDSSIYRVIALLFAILSLISLGTTLAPFLLIYIAISRGQFSGLETKYPSLRLEDTD